jgi:uncharacterized protein with HEPN domain
MSLSAYELLQHIRDEVKYILSNSENLSFDDFSTNETLIRAFSRSLEIIGEASKKIPKSFKNKYTDIPWRQIAGMRDKLIHDYFGVDLEIVWDVIQNRLPELNKQLTQIFKDFE